MNTIKKNHKPLIIKIIIFVVLFSAMEIYFGFFRQKDVINNVKIHGVFLAKTQTLDDNFRLTATNGESFHKESLLGHWTLLFFGFTNCGMVCPTVMAELNKTYHLLEKELPPTQLPEVIMISVDPERDTIKRLQSYVAAFNPHFSGARGSLAETLKLEKQFHVAAVKMTSAGTGNHYTINHSSEVILINPEGEIQAYFSYPPHFKQLASDYKLILSSVGE